jgi:hypothetical protein
MLPDRNPGDTKLLRKRLTGKITAALSKGV